MITYEGIFFKDQETVRLIHSLERKQLPKLYSPLHITFKFRPKGDEIFDEIVGSEIELLIIGYGCDGKNSGFLVKLPDDLEPFFINCDEHNPKKKKLPHITASLSEGAKAVDTKDLVFEPLEEPIVVTGRFGYKLNGQDFISYEPYKQAKQLIKQPNE